MEDRKIPHSALIIAIADYIKRHPEIKDSGKSYGEILALAIAEKVDIEKHKHN